LEKVLPDGTVDMQMLCPVKRKNRKKHAKTALYRKLVFLKTIQPALYIITTPDVPIYKKLIKIINCPYSLKHIAEFVAT
jgi:hypothetical protein